NCLFRNEQNFFAVRGHNYRFLSDPTRQLAASVRREWRRNPAWNSGLLEQCEKVAGPEFVNFAFQMACAVVDWNAQTGGDINQYFAMHIAAFDRRHTGNEPAFDVLCAKPIREIPRQRAELYPFQICSRRRLMRHRWFRPRRAQTIDNLKQQRACRSAADKRRVGAPVEISHPNSEHVMIEHRD